MKLLRFLLFPFAVLYDAITCIRNYCYDVGIFRAISFKIPVIAVGNLSVGGTGKTPQIEYLIRLLQDQKKVAVLSRGYRRKTKGFVLLNDSHTALDVGDEPLQFFAKFPKVSVAVDANRVQGIQQLQRQVNPDVILLDDAFQHRKVKAGFYVLLTKYNDLYTNDFLLPTGNLRESRSGAKRADVIVVTKCPQDLTEKEQVQIISKLKPSAGQEVLFSTIAYDRQLKGTNHLMVDELKDQELVLVTGIANPTPLLNYLKDKVKSIQHLNFPDHHNFSEVDIQKINKASEGKLLITTEKDSMRLKGRVEGLNYLEITTQFLGNQSKIFDQKIADYLA